MITGEIEKDLDWLIKNPDKMWGSIYHDAGKCWQLIELALSTIRELQAKLEETQGWLVTANLKLIEAPNTKLQAENKRLREGIANLHMYAIDMGDHFRINETAWLEISEALNVK